MKTGAFLVLEAQELLTITQKRYFSLKLKTMRTPDRDSEKINGKLWEEQLVIAENRKIPAIEAGKILKDVTYKEEIYKGEPQINILSYQVEENPSPAQKALFRDETVMSPEDFMTKIYIWKYWDWEMTSLFGSLQQEMENNGQWARLMEVCAGTTNHHGRRGGLLQHIGQMIDFAEDLCQVKICQSPTIQEELIVKCHGPRNFPGMVDFQVLRAAIILHDIGKSHDYNPETLAYEGDIVSALIQHSQEAMLIVERNWPRHGSQERKIKLQHCVLSHHGRSIAPVAPSIPEALLLTHIDALSAYLDVMKEAKKKKEEGKKPEFNKMMGMVPFV